jgi:hypothetical protein
VQRAHLGISSINYATTIKVCAEIRLAEVVRAGQEVGEIAKRGSARGNQWTGKVAPPDLTTLDGVGVTKQRLSEARKMAKQYTPETIRELALACNDLEIPLSRKQLLNGEAVQQSLTNEWYTPVEYLDAARAVLGGFDLNPARRQAKADALSRRPLRRPVAAAPHETREAGRSRSGPAHTSHRDNPTAPGHRPAHLANPH